MNRKIKIGPRGGKYILIKGKKRYISRYRNVKKRKINKFGQITIDVKNKRTVGKNHELKHRDVIEVITRK